MRRGRERERVTYEKCFYKTIQGEGICGFPRVKLPWCNSNLKLPVLRQIQKEKDTTRIIQYLGIAADEPARIEKHIKPNVVLPLVLAGWDEKYCLEWCKKNDLLSPIYLDSHRGGCWFCHNQSIGQLRCLKHNYPELWELLLKWDLDSPTNFRSEGHTIHDFDKRFQYEDEGKIPTDRKFRWKMLDEIDSNKTQD